MKVLVTGANGFVGRRVCCRFRSAGWNVVAALRKPLDAVDAPSCDEMVYTGSIEQFSGWKRALQGVDTIVHCAARTHVMRERNGNPLDAYRVCNVHGTERLLEGAAASAVRRVIYLSSIKAVGESNAAPFTESSPCHPEDAYGITKLEAERLIWECSSMSSFSSTVLRPPMVYGAGVKGNFARLMTAVKKGYPLPFAAIQNRRDLVYVENLVDAVHRCATDVRSEGKTFHVSDGEPVSTAELVQQIGNAMKRRPRLVPVPPLILKAGFKLLGRLPEFQRISSSLMVSNEHLRKTLDWTPPYSVQSGLLHMAAELSETSRPTTSTRDAVRSAA